MASSNEAAAAEKYVDPEDVAAALAKAVYDGDIVNFRLLFQPFSPARRQSTESFESEKYSYLLPDDDMEETDAYKEILAAVQAPDTWAHIEQELEADRPARLPAGLVVRLADRALVLGKYTSAAQAYEQLRIRKRMQALFFDEADKALREGDIDRGVRGYRIATGLEYNYAAFPEPLPSVPDYQTKALILHGDHPQKPEDCIGFKPAVQFVQTGLSYLLLSSEADTRLAEHDEKTRQAFFVKLVYALDPEWDAFAARCREAVKLARGYGKRIEEIVKAQDGRTDGLMDAISAQLGGDPYEIPATLLGLEEPKQMEWWQYLKELAYLHPAAALFVSRWYAGHEEIIVPRYFTNSPIANELNLAVPKEESAPESR